MCSKQSVTSLQVWWAPPALIFSQMIYLDCWSWISLESTEFFLIIKHHLHYSQITPPNRFCRFHLLSHTLHPGTFLGITHLIMQISLAASYCKVSVISDYFDVRLEDVEFAASELLCLLDILLSLHLNHTEFFSEVRTCQAQTTSCCAQHMRNGVFIRVWFS